MAMISWGRKGLGYYEGLWIALGRVSGSDRLFLQPQAFIGLNHRAGGVETVGRALLVSSILESSILAAARMRQIAGAWDKHVGCRWSSRGHSSQGEDTASKALHPALVSLGLLTSFALRADARVRQAPNKLLPRQQAWDGGCVCVSVNSQMLTVLQPDNVRNEATTSKTPPR